MWPTPMTSDANFGGQIRQGRRKSPNLAVVANKWTQARDAVVEECQECGAEAVVAVNPIPEVQVLLCERCARLAPRLHCGPQDGP